MTPDGTERAARETTGALLRTAGGHGAQRRTLLDRLPFDPRERMLADTALAIDDPGTLAMVLGGAATRIAHHGDPAVACGMAEVLVGFWDDPDGPGAASRALTPTELGGAVVVLAQACNRGGWTDRTLALRARWAGRLDALGDPGRTATHLAILVAEAHTLRREYDQAEAALPPVRPGDHPGAASLWDLVRRRIDALQGPAGDDTATDGFAGDDGDDPNGSIARQWDEALGRIEGALVVAAQLGGLPAMVVDLLRSRLREERTRPPQDKADLVEQLEALSRALGAFGASKLPGGGG